MSDQLPNEQLSGKELFYKQLDILLDQKGHDREKILADGNRLLVKINHPFDALSESTDLLLIMGVFLGGAFPKDRTVMLGEINVSCSPTQGTKVELVVSDFPPTISRKIITDDKLDEAQTESGIYMPRNSGDVVMLNRLTIDLDLEPLQYVTATFPSSDWYGGVHLGSQHIEWHELSGEGVLNVISEILPETEETLVKQGRVSMQDYATGKRSDYRTVEIAEDF